MNYGPQTYLKKPVAVRALQWTGANYADMEAFLESPKNGFFFGDKLYLLMGENEMRCVPGTWIVKGATGGYHPVPESVFERVYSHAEPQSVMHHPV